MPTKLTLRLDDQLIESAKKYSVKTGKSLSRIVADFFEMIKNEKLGEEPTTSPTVLSIRGALKEKKIDEDDYKIFLEKKYL